MRKSKAVDHSRFGWWFLVFPPSNLLPSGTRFSITSPMVTLDEDAYTITKKIRSTWNQQRVIYKMVEIKAVVLPVILANGEGMTAESLLEITNYPGPLSLFRGGLSRLVTRKFLIVDKSEKPWIYSLTEPLGVEHAKFPAKGRIDGAWRKKVMILEGRGEPIPEKPTGPVKVKKTAEPDPVEVKIIDILRIEGAITGDEIRELAKVYGYNIVMKEHIVRFLNLGVVQIDIDIEPVMWYTTPAFDEYINNQHAPHL